MKVEIRIIYESSERKKKNAVFICPFLVLRVLIHAAAYPGQLSSIQLTLYLAQSPNSTTYALEEVEPFWDSACHSVGISFVCRGARFVAVKYYFCNETSVWIECSLFVVGELGLGGCRIVFACCGKGWVHGSIICKILLRNCRKGGDLM